MRAALEVLFVAKYNINKHTSVAVKLLEMRRHLNQCGQCSAAIKAKSPDLLCTYLRDAILYVAIRWERNIPGRLAAARGKEPHIFPCPDLNAHGPAYALAAEACIVTNVTDRLC